MKALYMAVTLDKYELPVYVTDKPKDLAKWAGVTKETMHMYISKGRLLTLKGVKYIRVDMTGD